MRSRGAGGGRDRLAGGGDLEDEILLMTGQSEERALAKLAFFDQKARTVCNIGTQPVIPAVYGVKAPL